MRARKIIGDRKKVSCIILAGGKSSRMGKDKKFLLYGGKTFLEIAVENAAAICDEVIVSLGTREQEEELLSRGYDLATVVDAVRSKGPLMGLCSAMRRCTRDYVVVMPCDTPLLNPEVFRHLLEESRGWDAVIPVVRGLPEPLIGVYRVKPFLRACEEAVRSGNFKVVDAVKNLGRIKYLPMSTSGFLNVNTPEDMEEVRRHGR
jgi:molybdopterin-guanine dinucleotide biosynthesis protein A